jgi:methyltransferase (TIGR00027 family)
MSGASTTALMTALIRAVHTRRDPAPLLDDAYGDRFITAAERGMLLERFLMMLDDADRARLRALDDPAEALDRAAEANPAYGGVVVRSRWAEDRLLEATARGMRQYVIVGAGFDSFAFRRPAGAAALRVIEIDTAATVAAKRERAAAVGLVFDDRVRLIAADLEREGVGAALAQVPGSGERPSFVACLGVLPYLTATGVRHLLESIAASVAAGSEIVFDYLEPDAVTERAADLELRRVRSELAATGGESWRSGLAPEALPAQLAAIGMTVLEDLDGAKLRERYGAGRTLNVPRRFHVGRARVERG